MQTNDINGTGNHAGVVNSQQLEQTGRIERVAQQDRQEQQQAPAQPPLTGASGDQLSLTDSALNLQSAQQQVNALSEVDAAKVDSVKQALQSGSFKPDFMATAERMMGLESSLDL